VNGHWGTLLRDVAERDRAVGSLRRRRRKYPSSEFRLVQRVTTSTLDDPDTPPEPMTEATDRCLWCGTAHPGKRHTIER